ncbi:MAG: translation initiation factor IF-2 subunit beta [Candidatus Aenigmarchaeota archaeon]|nr:translation initiation factor IF-2 subunit beta [Candidatus Aenigmarchaeota archaeon]
MDDYLEMLRRARSNISSKETKRFEVPQAVTQLAGRQTVLKNLFELAKALRREPKHIARYMFKELAVPGEIRGNELYLQGKFPSSLVGKKIDEYVKEFVLCHECSKPDTIVQKAERIEILKCEACGARRPLRAI